MVARLLRDKGVYEYVEASRRVRADFPDARFLLVGRRDEFNPAVVPRGDLDGWQAEGTVRWLGEVADIREVLREADVVVLPSYREGLPRSLLEAAAMGKPVVTTDAPGCREVVDDGVSGLVVPVKDAPSLARAMGQLGGDPALRARMGSAGREKMLREFDERIVVDHLLRVYGLG
jgi:glycosyltransferase involved in cell wall biosynthesis